MALKWRIADGIGPFFKGTPNARINWSKIPFKDLDANVLYDETAKKTLLDDFKFLVEALFARDFNVVTLDDMAHLLEEPFYPIYLNEKIGHYQKLYESLFEIAKLAGMKVWITTDFIYSNDDLEDYLGSKVNDWIDFFESRVIHLFEQFPKLDGLILRIGEVDGKDVEGDFRSHPMIKYHHHLNHLLLKLMPIFEQKNKTLIMRTWSVGMYPVGDMMWNKSSLEKILKNVHSDHFVISMKYGESDFFRYLGLNKLFKKLKIPMIIELQARREYEGAGEYPSFIGYEYMRFKNKLAENSYLLGTMVWIQTGGWTHFKRLTFLTPEAIWNVINIDTIQMMFHHNYNMEEILERLHKEHAAHLLFKEFQTFMEYSHDVIRQLLYIESFAAERLYFRRIRIPPLMGLTWDAIWIHPMVARMVYHFGVDHGKIVRKGWKALAKLEKMKQISETYQWHANDIQFQYDTFHLLAIVREVYFGTMRQKFGCDLEREIGAYEKKYPWGYRIHYNPKVRYLRHDNAIVRWLRWLLRSKRGYRWVDRWIVIRLLALLFPIVYQIAKHRIPKELRNQAMGIGSLFK